MTGTELFLFPDVSESVTVSENIEMGGTLDLSVNDTVTATESVSVVIWAARAGLIHLRSKQQSYPLSMDSGETL